jgi:hypothetical protein
MIKITQSQRDYLIIKGFLKSERGGYPGLMVCNKTHKKMRKTYYIIDFYSRYLKNIL